MEHVRKHSSYVFCSDANGFARIIGRELSVEIDFHGFHGRAVWFGEDVLRFGARAQVT